MVKSIPTYVVLLRSYCVRNVEHFPPFGHNNFSTRQRTWEWTSPLFFWDQARVKWHITCPPSHLKFQSWVQDGGRGTHVTHFVQLYPQPLYTANQVRTTCRSWDEGVLTDLCLTLYNKPTRCNSGSIVFINNYKYALHVSDALCIHHQEHYKLQQQPLVFVMSWDGINPV